MNRTVKILKDLDEISRVGAELFVETASQAITARGRFLASFSGGSTPMRMYRLLATAAYSARVDWSKTHIFWGDERCVPPDDPGNCYGQAKSVLLDQVALPVGNIHRIESDLEPAAAATDYARRLRGFSQPPLDWPRFDLVLLGMGEDGHTASLFPGSPADVTAPALPVTAHYQDRPAKRVTLTPLVFNAARRILFLVSGAPKAEPLANVLFGDYHPVNLPAQRIDPTDGEIIWLVDEAAGGNIRPQSPLSS